MTTDAGRTTAPEQAPVVLPAGEVAASLREQEQIRAETIRDRQARAQAVVDDPYGPGFWAQKLEDMLFANPLVPSSELTRAEKDQVITLSKNMMDIAGYYGVEYRFATAEDATYLTEISRTAILGVAQDVLENTYTNREDPGTFQIWDSMRRQINKFAVIDPAAFEVGAGIHPEFSDVARLEELIAPALTRGEGEKWGQLISDVVAITGMQFDDVVSQIRNLWMMHDAGAARTWQEVEGTSKEVGELWSIAQEFDALMDELDAQFAPPKLKKTDKQLAIRSILAEMLPIWNEVKFSGDPRDETGFANVYKVYQEMMRDENFGYLMLMFDDTDMEFLEFLETPEVMSFVQDVVIPSAFAEPPEDPLVREDKVREQLRTIVARRMDLGVVEMQTAPVLAVVDELIDEWMFEVGQGVATITEAGYPILFEQWLGENASEALVDEYHTKINAERTALVPFEAAFGDLVDGVPQNQKRMLIQAYLQSYEDWYVAKNVEGYNGSWTQFVKDSDYAYGAWQQLQAIERAKAIALQPSGGEKGKNFDEWFTALESAVVKEPMFMPLGETKAYTQEEWDIEQADRAGFLRKRWGDIQVEYAGMKQDRSFRLNTYLTERAFFPAETSYLGQFSAQIWDDYEQQYPLANLLGRFATWGTYNQFHQATPEERLKQPQWKPFQEYLQEQDRDTFAAMLPVTEQRNIWRLPQQ